MTSDGAANATSQFLHAEPRLMVEDVGSVMASASLVGYRLLVVGRLLPFVGGSGDFVGGRVPAPDHR